MKTTAYFENIPTEIKKALTAANSEVIIAVAWFTDKTLFDQLCKLAGLGVRIRLAVLDDRINTDPGKLNFGRIEEISSDSHVYLIPSGKRNAIMHHKFCVVDRSTLITGSYNWTKKAHINDENITVIENNPTLCQQYIDVFNGLLAKHKFTDTPPIDTTQIKQRLEAMRNLVQLEDWESVQSQIGRIRSSVGEYGLEPLVTSIEQKKTKETIDWIADFIQRVSAITLADDMQVTLLRLELSYLEIQISTLYSDKAEIERIILSFSQQTEHALGDLITQYLKLKSLKQQHTAQDDYEHKRAEESRAEYEKYRDNNKESRETPPPPNLSADDTKTIKQLFREASQKVHPDKVGDEYKDRATEMFSKLNKCYQSNDIQGVRAIHAAIKNGRFDLTPNINESEALIQRVKSLRKSVLEIGIEINQVRKSENYLKAIAVTNFEAYIDEQKTLLNAAIEQIKQEISELGIDFPGAKAK